MHHPIARTILAALLATVVGSAHADRNYDEASAQAKLDAREPAVKAWLASPKVGEATRKRAASAIEVCFKGKGASGMAGLDIVYLLAKSGKVAMVFTSQATPVAACLNEEFSSLTLPAPPRSVYVRYVESRAP